MTRGRVIWILGAVLLVLTVGGSLWAQTSRSTILGTVTDQSGAVVPGTTITITNQRTNFQWQTSTSSTGYYEQGALPVGDYRVEATAKGFDHAVRTDLYLDVDQRLLVNFELKPGTTTTTVTVSGQAPLVQAETSSHGQIIGGSTIEDMPLNGRDYMDLPLLSVGVNTGEPGGPQTYYMDSSIAANGQDAGRNEYDLDGVDVTGTLGSTPGVKISLDSLEEFKVMTANYSAEYGGRSGIHMDMVSKSGTNALHGSGFEFVRNDVLDARNFFALSKPEYRQNQFGGNLGGPIRKDKAFFYFDYEGIRIREGLTDVDRIPTAAQIGGDLSALPQLYNPFSSQPNPSNPAQVIRAPIPNNDISSMLNPISQAVLKAYLPAPNNPADPLRNYIFSGSLSDDVNEYSGKIDLRPNNRNNFFGRYTISTRPRYVPGAFPLVGGDNQLIRPQNLVLSDVVNLSSNTLLEVSGSYTRYIANFIQQNQGKDIAGQLGIQGPLANPFTEAVPYFGISDFIGHIGDGAYRPNVETDNEYQFVAKLSHIAGPHSLKGGIDFRHAKWHQFTDAFFNGYFPFNGEFTSQVSSVGLGSGLADFLLGVPYFAEVSGSPGEDRVRMAQWSIYPWFQDDWRVTPNLTLNLGLRWEYNNPWTEGQNRWASFDLATGKVVYPHGANLLGQTPPYPYETADRTSPYNPVYSNFAPRFGFAYRPLGSNNTAIRGGFGLFYNNTFSVDELNVGSNFPWRQTRSVSSEPTIPQLDMATALVSGSLPALFGVTYNYNYTRREAVVTEWTFGIQRQLPAQMVLDVSYLGNKTTHVLIYGVPLNMPTLGPEPIQSRRPYPDFTGITAFESDGFATYNGLQVKLEKRLSKGLTFLTSYTWSKSLEDSEGFDGTRFANPFKELALASMYQANIFTTSFNYLLPIGTGHALLGGANAISDAVFGGWQATGIVTLDSGFPFTPTVAGDFANCGCTNYPIRLSNGNLPASQRSINEWFNPAAFTTPAPYTFGNAGRNILIGPPFRNLDFGLLKNFKINERNKLQARFEFFDFLNHPNFGFPNATVNTPSAGVISSADPGREVQFGIKWLF